MCYGRLSNLLNESRGGSVSRSQLAARGRRSASAVRDAQLPCLQAAEHEWMPSCLRRCESAIVP